MRPIRRRRSGFALLEVLVSLTIISITLVAAMRSFTASAKASKLSRNMTIGTMLARNLVEQWEIQFPGYGAKSGTFAPTYPDFSYEASCKAEKIKYDEKVSTKMVGRMVTVKRVSLDVYYHAPNDKESKRLRLVHVETALTDSEKFGLNSRILNGFDFE